jgi:hypothetical protein
MRWFSVVLVFACMFGRAEDETPLEREMLTYYVSNLGSDEIRAERTCRSRPSIARSSRSRRC